MKPHEVSIDMDPLTKDKLFNRSLPKPMKLESNIWNKKVCFVEDIKSAVEDFITEINTFREYGQITPEAVIRKIKERFPALYDEEVQEGAE